MRTEIFIFAIFKVCTVGWVTIEACKGPGCDREFYATRYKWHGSRSMYGLLTKREVKMTGYWPSSFFACLWTETKSRSINTQKKNEANIQSS